MYKITVIICVYNEEHSILKAVRSLYDNDIYPYTEIIIVDDYSRNATTLRILELLDKFTKVRVIYSRENLGLSNSRNLGFSNASTEYVLPLDADDTLPSLALDFIYQTFLENPEIDFIVGDYFLNDIHNNQVNLVKCDNIATNKIIDVKKLVNEWKLLGTSPCKKSTWAKIGGYSLKYSNTVQDMDFWIRVIQMGLQGLYLNKPIYTWNKNAAGMNTNFDRFDMIRILDDHKEFYLLSWTKGFLLNKIFEGYYPYKLEQTLVPFGKKHFYYLNGKNKLRLIYFIFKNSLHSLTVKFDNKPNGINN